MLLINKQTLCKDNKSSRNLIELEQEEKHWHLDIDITKFPPRKHGNRSRKYKSRVSQGTPESK